MTPRFSFKMTEQRLVIGFAALALIGLIIAGHSLFTAQGTTTIIVPPEAAAVVNGVPILRDDVEANLQALYQIDSTQATKAQKTDVLNSLVREELYVQRARELDTASFDSDVRAAYQKATQEFFAVRALTRQVGEGPLKEFYQAKKADFSTEGAMDVADFVFPKAALAQGKEIAAAVQSAGGAPEAAKKFGGVRRPDEGEAFYFAAHARLGDALFSVARELRDGRASEPIEQPDGVHVLYMVKNEPPHLLPFENVRLGVLAEYNLRAVGDEMEAMRMSADIKIAEDLK
ncbi:MAG: peptidylprolyl isomerase [Pseudomonadota bacterium]